MVTTRRSSTRNRLIPAPNRHGFHLHRTVTFAVILLIVAAFLSSASTLIGAQTTPTLEYFALGDSIASGHGLKPDLGDCRRSYVNSYPAQVADMLRAKRYRVDFSFSHLIACSGADTSKLLGANGQVASLLGNPDAYTPHSTVLVSITMGANDFGWYEGGQLKIWPHLVEDMSAYETYINQRSNDAASNIKDAISQILSAIPSAIIVVTQVHNPFPKNSVLFGATWVMTDGGQFIVTALDHGSNHTIVGKLQSGVRAIQSSAPCAQVLNADRCWERTELAVSTLNLALIKKAVQPFTSSNPNQVGYTPTVRQLFRGHEGPVGNGLCGWPSNDNDPDKKYDADQYTTWIQYPGDPMSDSLDWLGTLVKGDCFHPNRNGAEIYAGAVTGQFTTLLNKRAAASQTAPPDASAPTAPALPPAPQGGYWLPWQKGSVWQITAGNNEGAHTGAANQYAFDAVPASGRGTDLVTAVADGTVWGVQNSIPASAHFSGGHAGNCVIIDHGDGKYSMYAHLTQGSIPVTVGQRISHGTVIGQMGDTGYATGKHLQWSVGTRPRMYSQYGYTTCAEDTIPSAYQDPDKELQQDGGVPRTGRYYESFNDSGAASCSAKPLVTNNLSISPSNPAIGQDVTASFTVRNEGCVPFAPKRVLVGGRGPGGSIQDFPFTTPDPIQPGASYTYTSKRTFDTAGDYSFVTGYDDDALGWWEIGPASGNVTTHASIKVQACTPFNPVVTSNVSISPTTVLVGQAVTGTYTLRNDGCSDFKPHIIGLGGRGPGGDSDIQDIWDWSSPLIHPGGTYTVSVSRSFDHTGQFNFVAGWVDNNGAWFPFAPADNSVSPKASITVAANAAIPRVVTRLAVSPNDPMIGDAVTATFQVRNDGNTDFKPNLIGVAARGPGGVNEDVAWLPNIVIGPGQTWTYTAARRFDSTGDRTFFISYRDDAGAWRGIDPVSGVSTTVTLTVQACAARPVLTQSLVISPAQPRVGENVTATYKVKNTGCAAFSPKTIGAGGRGPGGANDIQDFNFYPAVVVQPNDDYTYTATRTFGTEGVYSFDTSYRTADDHWIRIPVSDSSIVNMTSISVMATVPTAIATPTQAALPASPLPTEPPANLSSPPVAVAATGAPIQATTIEPTLIPSKSANEPPSVPNEPPTVGSLATPVTGQPGDGESGAGAGPFEGVALPIQASNATWQSGETSHVSDGDPGTAWSPVVRDVTLTFDLGKTARLTGVRWMYGADGSADNLAIDTSKDGQGWLQVGTLGGGAGGAWYTQAVTIQARYVRFTLSNPGGVRGNLAEVEIWGGVDAKPATNQEQAASTPATITASAPTDPTPNPTNVIPSRSVTTVAQFPATQASEPVTATASLAPAPATNPSTVPGTATTSATTTTTPATSTAGQAQEQASGPMILPANGSSVVAAPTSAGPVTNAASQPTATIAATATVISGPVATVPGVLPTAASTETNVIAPVAGSASVTDHGNAPMATATGIQPDGQGNQSDVAIGPADTSNRPVDVPAGQTAAPGTATQATPRVLTVTPTADGNMQPGAPFSTPAAVSAPVLTAGGPEGQMAYVVFDVQGIAPGTVVSAQLVVTNLGDPAPSGDILVLAGVPFDPSNLGATDLITGGDVKTVAGIPALPQDQETRIDVSGTVSADGTVIFLLRGTPEKPLTIAGDQSPTPPRLELTVQDS